MADFRDHKSQASTPIHEASQADLVREIRDMKDGVLDALNGLFMGVKTAQNETSDRVRSLEHDMRHVRSYIHEIPTNLRNIGKGVHAISRKIRKENVRQDDDDDCNGNEGCCGQCDCDENEGYLDSDQGWGDPQDAEPDYENEAYLDSAQGWGNEQDAKPDDENQGWLDNVKGWGAQPDAKPDDENNNPISEDLALANDSSGKSGDSDQSSGNKGWKSSDEKVGSSSNDTSVGQHEDPTPWN